MSKTYYKYPSLKDYSRNYTRWAKRQASKMTRCKKEVANGSAYKKFYCSYNIFDHKMTYYTDNEVFESWFADEKLIYRIPKKSLVKHFKRKSIKFIID